MGNIVDEKEALRQEMISKRDALSSAFRHEASDDICKHDLSGLFASLSGPVSFYMPIKSEIDPEKLARCLAAGGVSLCLPRIVPGKKVLDFKAFDFDDQLHRGAYDVMEPLGSKKSVKPVALLMPLLAVDIAGNRLGYGGGYYDHTLEQLRKEYDVVTIGLAFDIQLIQHVPHDHNDVPLDWLITEEDIRQF